jgi:hypothetical protein
LDVQYHLLLTKKIVSQRFVERDLPFSL